MLGLLSLSSYLASVEAQIACRKQRKMSTYKLLSAEAYLGLAFSTTRDCAFVELLGTHV